MTIKRNVIIVGAGPVGLRAALLLGSKFGTLVQWAIVSVPLVA
jgi:2-polyprenyl-6-methoxyphenol hydroxylase-like FAD-dependent oxidoreductase